MRDDGGVVCVADAVAAVVVEYGRSGGCVCGCGGEGRVGGTVDYAGEDGGGHEGAVEEGGVRAHYGRVSGPRRVRKDSRMWKRNADLSEVLQ